MQITRRTALVGAGAAVAAGVPRAVLLATNFERLIGGIVP